ncbi:ATP-grasp domain-containing protein [Aeromicrobium ginsengisoli]|uniref:ATP-grasp domain-containing protein n=1 Tax=Aeromicrobium ginsengisoli TaxID=363867 RepID=A0A5M4FEV0_9ACTN|nr:ATP-grasp domain-containing protein [Aeromicrobium ginsengisoli]KAA1397730.1 ATP-grasp domain-containing protein [Aeromicrobium ginsengisoli]
MTTTQTGRSSRHDRPRGAPGALVIGGDYQGLGIARSLGRRGISVAVLDDEVSIAPRSRYVRHSMRVPTLRSPEATADALHEAARRFGLDGWVLFPTREETVAAIAQHRDDLARTFRVPTPSWETVRVAWDKRQTYQVAERLGIEVPRCWFPRSESDLSEIALDSPVIIKPAIKEHFFYDTGAKAWRANDRAELVQKFREATAIIPAEEVIVQELVPGAGDRQLAYCAFVKDGEPVGSMTVVRRRQHPSDFGRASTFVETVELPELEAPSLRLLREMNYYGLVELEFKRDERTGAVKLLDVNARTWGYHGLGAAAGVDFPALLHRDQMGLPVQPCRASAGVRWVRLATDVPNALRDISRRQLRLWDYLRSLRGIDVGAVWALDDPLPALAELGILPRLALSRGL